MNITALPSSTAAWARYCVDRPVPLMQYAYGYELLTGPAAASWLARGFDELLKTIRNSV